MKIAVFGATGGTGRATVGHLLASGHDVTAFARNPNALGLNHERLRIIQGDVMDAAAVQRAVAGQDGVIVALGITTRPFFARLGAPLNTPLNVCSVGTRNVIAAMQHEGVRRLVCVTAWGVADSRNKIPWFFRLFLTLFLQERYRDKERQEEEVRRSGRDWTIVRPVGLGNGPATGDYSVSTDGVIRHALIPRADVAAFACKLVTGGDYVGETVALSG